jgi:chromosome segregation ATPase
VLLRLLDEALASVMTNHIFTNMPPQSRPAGHNIQNPVFDLRDLEELTMRPTFYASTQVSNSEYESRHARKQKMQADLDRTIDDTAKAVQRESELKTRIEEHEALKAQLTTDLANTEEPVKEQEKRVRYWSTELTKVNDVVIKAEARILQMELDKRDLNLRLHEQKSILEKQFETEKSTRARLEEIKLSLAEKEQEVSKLRIAARLKNIKLPADLK